MESTGKIEAMELEDAQLSIPVRKEELLVLKFLTFFYFITCLSTAAYGFLADGVQYEYNTILTPSFICLSGFLVCVIFLLWHRKENERGMKSTIGVIVIGGIKVFGGFLSFIGLLVAPGEGTAAAVVLLWIVSGAIIMHFGLDKRLRLKTAPKVDVVEAEPMSRGYCCALWTCRIIAIAVILFIEVLVAAFIINSVRIARDSFISPLGNIYTIKASTGHSLRMHLACSGEKTSTNTTWVFEHGGGSNSVALKGLADVVSGNAGARVCVYDRLGYGFSPSFVTRENRLTFDSSGELLRNLLTAAGEVGPYNCVGHSAGAGACLDFAVASSEVIGLGFLDGYPDIIRAGNFRPGNFSDNDSPAKTITAISSLLIGSTGILRGVVGDPGDDFVRPDLEDMYEALYGQNRFWFSQYWDLVADEGAGVEGGLFVKTNGTVQNTSLVDYGSNLDVAIVVIPAFKTVTNPDCGLPQNSEEFCCGDEKDSKQCENQRFDRTFFLNQATLYASTIGRTPGVLTIAPPGTEHGFPYSKFHVDFTAAELINNLP